MNSKPKLFYIGVKGLIKKDKKVLILKRLKENETYWDLPGGRINEDENQIEALKRELEEEIPSIKDIKIGDVVSSYKFNKDLKEGGLFFIFYNVEANLDKIETGEEHSDYKWIDLESLDSIKEDIFEGYYNTIKICLLK